MKRIVALICLVLLVFFLIPVCSSIASFNDKEKHTESVSDTLENVDIMPEASTPVNDRNNSSNFSELQITVLDVGQGLSVLIGSDNEYVLYDGGGKQHSSYVVSYLRHHGVDSLEYLIASHYDEDHVAGLIGVLRTIPVNESSKTSRVTE